VWPPDSPFRLAADAVGACRTRGVFSLGGGGDVLASFILPAGQAWVSYSMVEAGGMAPRLFFPARGGCVGCL